MLIIKPKKSKGTANEGGCYFRRLPPPPHPKKQGNKARTVDPFLIF